jgi:hypothetical protein
MRTDADDHWIMSAQCIEISTCAHVSAQIGENMTSAQYDAKWSSVTLGIVSGLFINFVS